MDARKSLQVLHDEWKDCVKCELGVRRYKEGGRFVFGEGSPKGGILFVGEGPGKEEEKEGLPFIGPSGRVLRAVIQKFGLRDYFITNIVACRSCEMMTNPDGTPLLGKSYGGRKPQVRYKDTPPTPAQIAACLPRLYELIYIIDPVLIVSLGAPAASALTGKSVAITTEAGVARHITIPGASVRASLTEKKGVWVRKSGGELVAPMEQNEVSYLLIPTLHPAYVLYQASDKREGRSATWRFASDIRKAVKVYERYMFEVFNQVVSLNEATNEEVAEAVDQSQEQPENPQDFYHE